MGADANFCGCELEASGHSRASNADGVLEARQCEATSEQSTHSIQFFFFATAVVAMAHACRFMK